MTKNTTPGTDKLTADDLRLAEAARSALNSVAKTFNSWLTVGAAVQALRHRADHVGGRQTFQRFLDEQDLGKDPINPGTITVLLHIMDRQAEVVAWHATLTPKQQREWGSPSSVYRHCPIFKKDAPPKPQQAPNATVVQEMDRLEDQLEAVREENERLRKEVAQFKPKLRKSSLPVDRVLESEIHRLLVVALPDVPAEARPDLFVRLLSIVDQMGKAAERLNSDLELVERVRDGPGALTVSAAAGAS